MFEEAFQKLAAGGPLMIPIALVSLAAWTLLAERWLWFRSAGNPAKLLQAILPPLAGGDLDGASRLCRGGKSAVARACAANPVAVVVPCHRVLRRDGGTGGYRWGIDRKRAMLVRESESAQQ